MPLARYDIRNEYSLANPDLYRAAVKDDPEGLLEGVAMAGLVGIVRQLGDLAEFAAEVFHELHEEVLATAARGHELLIRVQQLEAELPAVEKLLLFETDQVSFAYTSGVEWHASIRNDQNHLTQGDLPRFIRNSYEECRGPPRLFLLDKFDVAGAGACLKRYTDPSFFKMEWASSELMKAEKEQQDKRARRIKKKGRRRRNGEIKEASPLSQMHPRVRYASLDVENLTSTSGAHSYDLDSGHRPKMVTSAPTSGKSGSSDRLQASTSQSIPVHEGANLKVDVESHAQNGEISFDDACSKPLKISAQEIDGEGLAAGKFAKANPNEVVIQNKEVDLELKAVADVGDDVASEAEHFMDALTTMESEVETDSESKAKLEVDSDFNLELREEGAPVLFNHSHSDNDEVLSEETFDAEKDLISIQPAAGNLEPIESMEPVLFFTSPPKAGISSVEENKASLSDHSIASPSLHESNISPSLHESNASPSLHESNASPSLHESNASPSLHESNVSPSLHESNASPSLQESSVSPSLHESNASPSPIKDNAAPKSDHLESGSIDHVSETPPTSELNDHGNTHMENLAASFQLLPEPAIPLANGGHTGSSGHLGSLSSHKQAQSTELRNEAATRLMQENSKFEEPGSGLTETPEELSPRSPPDSTIQPLQWAMDFSKAQENSLDTDDDIDGMQISSSSPSSSSSALSSPRPSMLATTVFHTDSEGEAKSALSSQGSTGSSPRSSIFSALHSPMSPVQMASDYLASSEPNIQNLQSEILTPSSPTLRPRFIIAEPEHSPPLPPLPPLEWRTMRPGHSFPLSSLRVMEPPRIPPAPPIPPIRPGKLLQDLKPFVVPSKDERKDSPLPPSRPDKVLQDSSPSLVPSKIERNSSSIPPARPDQVLQDSSPSLVPSKIERNSSSIPPARLDRHLQDSSPSVVASKIDRKDSPIPPARSDKLSQDLSPSMAPSKIERNNSSVPPARSDKLLQGASPSVVASEIERKSSPMAPVRSDKILQDSSPFVVASKIERNNSPIPPARSDKILQDSSLFMVASKIERKDSPTPSAKPDKVLQDSSPVVALKFERKDSLIESIASHNRSMLKKVTDQNLSPRPKPAEDREVLLEQIRTRSFSLRRTIVEKHEAPNPIPNINVAAILEKANAIRQAFAGSDEDDDDDDWSDT